MSIRKAADKLQIKKSTAERILSRFRQQGTFFESAKAKQDRKDEEKAQKRRDTLRRNMEASREKTEELLASKHSPIVKAGARENTTAAN